MNFNQEEWGNEEQQWWDRVYHWLETVQEVATRTFDTATEAVTRGFQGYVWDFGQGEAALESVVGDALDLARAYVAQPLIEFGQDVADWFADEAMGFFQNLTQAEKGAGEFLSLSGREGEEMVGKFPHAIFPYFSEWETKGEENLNQLSRAVSPPLREEGGIAERLLSKVSSLLGEPLLWILTEAFGWAGRKVIDFIFEEE